MVGGRFVVDNYDDQSIVFEEDVFDKIEDLLDFDKLEDMQLINNHHHHHHHHPEQQQQQQNQNQPINCFQEQHPWPPKSDFLSSFKVGFSLSQIRLPNPFLYFNFNFNSIQCDIDVAELEWLSNFVEDSFSPTAEDVMLLPKVIHTDNGSAVTSFSYSSSSPTSSSSCSTAAIDKKAEETTVVRGRAPRSKRPRPHVPVPVPVPMPVVVVAPNPVLPDNEFKDEKRKKLKTSLSVSATNRNYGIDEREAEKQVVRKCLHCDIQKTPQWRAGPMGPKTLCNACGVRYKSGRLFPEYRPAASPTFVPDRHSNSHKMVVEMRVKSSHTKTTTPAIPSLPVSAKGCELLNYIK